MTVLLLLLMEGNVDNKSLRNAFGIDLSKASTLLKSLVEDNFIDRIGKSAKFAKYALSQEWKKKIEQSLNGGDVVVAAYHLEVRYRLVVSISE
jgi:DNA-binding MarR family transcriptional regulator